MRSRYAAFACSEPEYLVRTLHSTHEGLEAGEKVLEQRIAIACRKYKYRGLWILDSAPPDAEGTAEVLFFAKVYESGKDKSFVERSKFKHDGTGWRYVDGLLAEKKDLTVDPKALKLDTFAQMVA
ncbi:MAG: hypothetical protein JST92_17505 [Deltaproteobacteria bacterium]|nr:hypothetical protein [Deltaproteobacteria bacterium]